MINGTNLLFVEPCSGNLQADDSAGDILGLRQYLPEGKFTGMLCINAPKLSDGQLVLISVSNLSTSCLPFGNSQAGKVKLVTYLKANRSVVK